MKSEKKGAAHLIEVFKNKGLKDIVICPGSRNSPLTLSFTGDDYFNCFSIVDERSASFFALGMAQFQQKPVAVVCTSGSALLNMAPAVAEAYYQRVPLLIVSADRPIEWLNQGESQTLDQSGIYRNYVRASYDLIQEPNDKDSLWYHDRQLSQAIDQTCEPYFGPVHINIRFREPLYKQDDEKTTINSALEISSVRNVLSDRSIEKFRTTWNKFSKVMIVCGQMHRNEALNGVLNQLADKNVVVLSESTSNINSDKFFPCIDKIIMPSSDKAKENLKPDLLLTIGGPLISRKIKTYLRTYHIEHWHIDPIDNVNDAYQHQSKAIAMHPEDFLKYFEKESDKKAAYFNLWTETKQYVEDRHIAYLNKAEFSDLKAFDIIFKHLPKESMLHIGNSASIRYVQLFDESREKLNFCNRGTSGIEGSVSTAVGASQKFDGPTVLINGDLSTLYDSNAFWNNYLKPNFKMLVINNGGGGIFRIIEGPDTVQDFEKYIETQHNTDFSKLASLYNLSYYSAESTEDLESALPVFMKDNDGAAMLEVKTQCCHNDKILKQYFDYLKQS